MASYVLTCVAIWVATWIGLASGDDTMVSVYLSIGGTAALLLHGALAASINR